MPREIHSLLTHIRASETFDLEVGISMNIEENKGSESFIKKKNVAPKLVLVDFSKIIQENM